MVHLHSPAKMAERRQREAERGFLRPTRQDRRCVEVQGEIAPCCRAMVHSAEVHLRRYRQKGGAHHHARLALRVAEACGAISGHGLRHDLRLHRANRAKHALGGAKQPGHCVASAR